MLEVVGVEIAAVKRDVGLDVVGVFHDFQRVALGLKVGAGGFQNFGMGGDGGADLDGDGSDAFVALVALVALSAFVALVGGAGAQRDGKHQNKCEKKRKFLFHGCISFFGFFGLLCLFKEAPASGKREKGDFYRMRLSTRREIFSPSVWKTSTIRLRNTTITARMSYSLR